MSIDKTASFQFYDDGFILNTESINRKILWKEIESIHVYKNDLVTYDEVCLNLNLENITLTISEEVPGFDIFTSTLQEVFPTIDKNWFENILKPPFEANFTVLYKREDHR